jgi:hypothetical protein
MERPNSADVTHWSQFADIKDIKKEMFNIPFTALILRGEMGWLPQKYRNIISDRSYAAVARARLRDA